MVDAGPVVIAAAVAQDGDQRTRRIDYPLVQCAVGATPDQAAALAYLDAAAAREAGPIVLPLKPRWIGARFGDCWTLPTGMGDLSGKTVLVRERSLDPVSGVPTLSFLTEDMSKYPIALAQTGVAAPIPDKSVPVARNAPSASDWSHIEGSSSITINGAVTDVNATSVTFEYREVGATNWIQWSSVPATTETIIQTITGLDPAKTYEVAISYYTLKRLVLTPITLDPAAPNPTTNTEAAGGVGEITASWRNPGSTNYDYTRIFITAGTTFTSPIALTPDDAAGALQYRSRTFTGVTAGTWYVWSRAYSASDVPAAPHRAATSVIVS
jgi:hypothetical protein